MISANVRFPIVPSFDLFSMNFIAIETENHYFQNIFLRLVCEVVAQELGCIFCNDSSS